MSFSELYYMKKNIMTSSRRQGIGGANQYTTDINGAHTVHSRKQKTHTHTLFQPLTAGDTISIAGTVHLRVDQGESVFTTTSKGNLTAQMVQRSSILYLEENILSKASVISLK